MDSTLERLAAGIKAADAAGNEEDVRQLAAEFRRVQSQAPQGAPEQPNTDWGSAIMQGADNLGQTIGHGVSWIGEAMGAQPVQSAGQHIVDSHQRLIDERGYQRPENNEGVWTDLSKGEFGDAIGSAGRAVAENAVSVVPGLAMGLPGLLTRGVGAVGLGIQTLGETRSEKEEKGLDTSPVWQDVATALASGLIELTPIGKGKGYNISFTREGLQEAAQEGSIMGSTALQGGEYVSEEVGNRLLEAGIAGGVTSKGIDVASNAIPKAVETAGDAIQSIRTDSTDRGGRAFDSISRDVVDRIEATVDNLEVLGDVATTERGNSAQAAIKGVIDEIKKESQTRRTVLKSLIPSSDTESLDLLKKVAGGTLKGDQFESSITKFENKFGHIKEGAELANLARQQSRISHFGDAMGDVGGMGRFTRRLDVLDRRNSGIAMGMAAGGLGGAGAVGGGGPLGLVTAMAAGTGINRAARGIDNLLNTRSTVKRWYDSAKLAPTKPTQFPELTVKQILDQQKAQKAAEKLAAKQATQESRNRAKVEKETARKAEADRLANEYSVRARSLEPIFEEGAGRIDETDKSLSGYIEWQRAIPNLEPSEILETLEAIERDVPEAQGAARKYREDVRSFNTGEAIALQRMVRQRHDLSYPNEPSADSALRKLEFPNKMPKDRRQERQWEGARAKRNLDAKLENAKANLPSDAYLGLKELAQQMNSPAANRDMRYEMMDDTLQGVFPNPRDTANREFWRKEFIDLASAGNDEQILRPEQETEQVKEQEFEKKLQEAQPANTNSAPSRRPTADDALAKLDQSNVEPEAEPESPSDATLDSLETNTSNFTNPSIEDVRGSVAPSRTRGKGSLARQVQDRLDDRHRALEASQNQQDTLQRFIENLPKNDYGRVAGLMVDMANSRLTQNQLTDSFRERFADGSMPPEQAAKVVDDVLSNLERQGVIKRIVPFGSSNLRADGKFQKTEDGDPLKVVQIEFQDNALGVAVEIAKATNTINKMAGLRPKAPYTLENLQDGSHRAFKDYDAGYIQSGLNGDFTPQVEFIQALRDSRWSLNPSMLDQIEVALGSSHPGNHLSGLIRPVTGTRTVRNNKTGKITEKPVRSDENIRTLAQIQFILGDSDNRTSTEFEQEFTAGANGRVYTRNGMMHTQAGKMMKGLTRLAHPVPLGGNPEALKRIFHSFGNLLGFDKDSPSVRRGAVFQGDTLDTLLKFAEKPFDRGALKREGKDGKETDVGKLVKDGESFWEVLNTAHEAKKMVEFARERHPDKAKASNKELLLDPAVQQDLANNYSTDFIVQLDANNNAYQLVGLTMGYPEVLQATGMAPGSGDPDSTQGADIYLEPAKDIARRVPDLNALGLPDKVLRKIFKRPIGTYLYEAEYNSRKDAFRDALNDVAGDSSLIGVGSEKALITVPENVVQGMMGDGHTFMVDRYDQDGELKTTEPVTRRVVQDGEAWRVQSGNRASRKFATPEDAIREAYASDLFGRMNRELVRDLNARYPGIRDYLSFARTVSDMVKANGGDRVRVKTPDGMILESRFKNQEAFTKYDAQVGDNVVPLGIRTGQSRITGRGVAAFMMHQLDAYVLRETYRRARAEGYLEAGFNPIHDSYGMAAADATRVQEIWAEVMQELGNPDFNIFLEVLQENGISLDDFVAAGGVLPNRQGVTPVPFSQIPTSLS